MQKRPSATEMREATSYGRRPTRSEIPRYYQWVWAARERNEAVRAWRRDPRGCAWTLLVGLSAACPGRPEHWVVVECDGTPMEQVHRSGLLCSAHLQELGRGQAACPWTCWPLLLHRHPVRVVWVDPHPYAWVEDRTE